MIQFAVEQATKTGGGAGILVIVAFALIFMGSKGGRGR